MAATLTDELTRVSVASIEKWDEADGTVYVYGRCTTPEVDTDDQVVDSGWSGPALKEYLATAPTVRVQHNPQRDPAGSAVRVDVNRDGDGAHWLKAAVDEPVAQRLVKKGHLRAFSVGIARPLIERDVTGKARGGVIKGGKIVEVSLVDSPANRSCFLEIAKSAADGTCEFTGKVGGDDDVLQKALSGGLLTKDGNGGDIAEKSVAPAEPAGIDTWTASADLDISFTPNDMMRLMQSKFVEKHYDDLAVKAVIDAEAAVYKRDIDTATRRRLAADGKALPNLSYPIESTGDLGNAATLARSGHGDVAAARRLIARRARELGVTNPLDEGDDVKKAEATENDVTVNVSAESGIDLTPQQIKGMTEQIQEKLLARERRNRAPEAAEKEAEPEVTKDPEPEPEPAAKKAKKPKGGKKLPPWLNKPKDDDGDSDADDDSKACKSAADHLWTGVEGTSDIECSKCHTTPAQAAGVTASAMNPAPVGELMETPAPASVKGATPASASGAVGESMKPVPAHREPDGAAAEAFEATAGMSDGDHEAPTRLEATMKGTTPEVAALLRFQHAGIDPEAGRLHDLTCPAYHPADVAKHHPFADFATAIDLDGFQRKAMTAAAGGDLSRAKAMQQVLYAASALKTADAGFLNDCRLAAYKAFRDANPGPSSYPTPGAVSPQVFCRPLVTDGHEASSAGHSGPTTSPQVATSPPDAHGFDRPPLSAGHQSPSPSFMKASFEYPDGTGRPAHLNYASMEKDRARQALMQVHEHLSRQFPEACPISLDGPQQPERKPVPPIAGIGKSADEQPPAMCTPQEPAPSALAALKAEPEQDGLFADADVYKGFKKMRKKLGKKVLSGSMTVDEARAKLGRQFAQKGAESEPEVAKAAPAVSSSVPGAEVVYNMSGTVDPAVIKAAVTEALRAQTVPLEAATVEAFDPSPAIEAAVTKAVTPLLEKIQAQDTKLAETQRVIDAIADQPDPSTAAFSGLAFKPVHKTARPAAVPDIAESAARAQDMIRRNLMNTYYTNSSPARREAAGEELAKLGWETPMT